MEQCNDLEIRRKWYFLQKELEKYCQEWRMRAHTQESNAVLCSKVEVPVLKFGCSKSSSSRKKSKKKSKRYFKKKYKFRFRKWKPTKNKTSFKPRFFKKKNRKVSRKPSQKVRCFGCQEIGHYANKMSKEKDTGKGQSGRRP